MDVVPNHCSSQHRWFLDALAAAPGSPERARFYFRDGKGPHGSEPPNNWQAAFGGSAWTRATADSDLNDTQWYLGTFTPHQPDFDHTNADVQAMFADVLRFWFDRGVEGFRVDAITPVGKDPALPDQPPVGPEVGVLDITWANPYTVFREEGHVVWRQWRTVIDGYAAAHPERDLMMVAEAYATRRPELVRAFTRRRRVPSDVRVRPDAVALAQGVGRTGARGHHRSRRRGALRARLDAEQPRHPTHRHPPGTPRSGGPRQLDGQQPQPDRHRRRPRTRHPALACTDRALAFAVPGSLYLYQGEELGLPEVFDIPDDRREDPVFHLTHGAGIGRDGCRIPLPWTADPATSFGFSTPTTAGAVNDPWLPQPSTWGLHAASGQQHPGTMLDLYQQLSAARRRHAVPQGLGAHTVDLGPGLVGLRRGSLLVVMNVTHADIDLSGGELLHGAEVIIATEPTERAATIAADSTTWFSLG